MQQRAAEFADASDKPDVAQGIALGPIERTVSDDGSVSYGLVEVSVDRAARRAEILIKGPEGDAPADVGALVAEGDQSYILRLARELEDAILHLRLNEMEAGLWVIRSQGDPDAVLAHEALILGQP